MNFNQIPLVFLDRDANSICRHQRIQFCRLTLKSVVSEFISRQVVDRFQENEFKSIIMAITSGILLTILSTLYSCIEKDIDKSTILVLRGVYQMTLMLIFTFYYLPSLEP